MGCANLSAASGSRIRTASSRSGRTSPGWSARTSSAASSRTPTVHAGTDASSPGRGHGSIRRRERDGSAAMTEKQQAIIYELMRTVDFRKALEHICGSNADKAKEIMGTYLESGNVNGALIARGEAKAWDAVLKVLDRVAKKAAPDNS